MTPLKLRGVARPDTAAAINNTLKDWSQSVSLVRPRPWYYSQTHSKPQMCDPSTYIQQWGEKLLPFNFFRPTLSRNIILAFINLCNIGINTEHTSTKMQMLPHKTPTVPILPLTEVVWVWASSDSELPIKWSTVLTQGTSGRPEYALRTPRVQLASCAFHQTLSQQVRSRWEGDVTHTWLSSLLLPWRG